MLYKVLVDKNFSIQEVDCAITVALKIIDKKCQMDAQSQAMFMSLYGAVVGRESALFDYEIYTLIDKAIEQPCLEVLDKIHRQRVYAMESIPKPVMKAFKQSVRILIAKYSEEDDASA